jgi:multiple sugar transport system substrate-binding protein
VTDRFRLDRRPGGLSRRDFLRYAGTAGLSLGALGLAGCSDSGSTSDAPADAAAPQATSGASGSAGPVSGRVEVWFYGEAASLASFETIFDAFRQLQPEIELVTEALPAGSWSAYADTVASRIAGGQVPDVLRIATEGQRVFAHRGLLAPLDPYIERDRDQLTDFFEDSSPQFREWQEQFSPDGQTYFIPAGFNTMVVWYNQRVFEEAGVEPPQDDWTWDESRRKSEQIFEATGNFAMNIPPAYFAGVVPWLLSNGASVMNADWTAATLDTPEALEATRFMVDYVQGQLSPEPGGEFDQFALTGQGEMAMFGGGRWPLAAIRDQEAVDDMAIVEWPQGATKGTPVGWSGWPMLEASENKDAAWEFLKFMTTVEASEAQASGGTEVPPRESVALGPLFAENAPEGMGKVFEAVEYATPIPGPDEGAVIQADIEDTFEQMFIGNVPPQEGLEALNERINGLLQV